MKASQLKIMLGWLIGITTVCVMLLAVVLVNQLSINKRIRSLGSGSQASDTSQLTSLQSSVDALSAKVGASSSPTVSPSTMMTCTGTLSQNLSGSASQIGSFTDYSLSGSSPINLTCNKL